MLIMRKRLAAMAMVVTMLATGIMTGCASGSAPKEEGNRQQDNLWMQVNRRRGKRRRNSPLC